MNAKEGYIIRMLDGADKKFVIPVYQRPYSWKKSNCVLLFNDLMDVYKNNYSSHFFGSLVYVENELGGCSEYTIIDGQQRLTTVSLLLLAIRNYILATKLNIGVNPTKITNVYLTDEYAGDKKLKLKLIQGDDEAYDRLIEKTEPITNNNITVNYNFFYDQIATLSGPELKGLYDAIMKLMVVNISLQPHNGDDPQMIFESLNSTGLDLEEADKIRNFVLMKLNSKEQEKVYKNYWEKLEIKIGKPEMNKFIRYYLSVKTRELPNESKLYFEFKKYREQLSHQSITDILSDMIDFAEYYRVIKNSNIGDASYLNNVARINKLEINTVMPLLLDLFQAKHTNALSDNEMFIATTIIESYIVRRIICGLPASSLNKVFVYIGAEIEKHIEKNNASYFDALTYALLNKTGKSRFPNDHDFSEKFIDFELYNAKPSTKKFILERLENHNNKERVAVEEQIDSGDLTIEHIMPQTLTREWKEHLGNQWELTHSKYKDTIGNLTLTAYNSDYSNLIFTKKRDMKDKGFKFSKLSLNRKLGYLNKWDEEEIIIRSKDLLSRALDLWRTPKTDFIPNVVEEWVYLDEEMDFTNKSIVRFNLLGDEIVSNNITDAYKKINEILYAFDPVCFLNAKNSYVSDDASKLRVAYELGPSIYIETNLSSQAKITVLKELFEAFEIESQELKFLVRPKRISPHDFDINDETTYYSLRAGALAYKLISSLLEQDKIDKNEKSLLMTREYSQSKFKKVAYPVLALSRDANKGESDNFRYYKTPVIVDGISIFITSQWFNDSRESLIEWYKSIK